MSSSVEKLGGSAKARSEGLARRDRTIELLLADDHPLLLRGLRDLFDRDERFRVVAIASDGERLLHAIERFAVDVVVMGWLMPYRDGEEVLQELRGRANAPRIVVYSGLEDPSVPRRVMALGGAAFCSKRTPPEDLLDVVAAVAAGQMIFPYEAAQERPDPLAELTERELEIVRALASSRNAAQLAHDLAISQNTLKFHLKNVYAKLGVTGRAQAVALYLSSQRPR